MTETAPGTATFYASLLYEDADAAIEWLERVLGCERREVHRDESGGIAHAELSFGGSIVMLGSAGVGREPFRSIPAGDRLLYCAVDDVDRLHDRAVASGAEIALPLTDTDYGSRDFTVRDLEGNLWAFGTYRPTVERRG
jgi:uncharacterized glyoxalase superfamily protein PhnB